MTFASIQSTAAKLGTRRATLGARIDDILDNARINADDTVYVEKAAPVADWDRIALASLQSLLSYCGDSKAVAWFRRNGVEF